MVFPVPTPSIRFVLRSEPGTHGQRHPFNVQQFPQYFQEQKMNESINTGASIATRVGSRVLSASSLSSDDVYDPKGEKLGSIKELMLDIDTGKVCYAVLSFGGFLSLGEKLFAVPWQALTVDTQNHRLIMDTDEERLKNAPGFDTDNWPDMADASWGKSVHTHYGTTF